MKDRCEPTKGEVIAIDGQVHEGAGENLAVIRHIALNLLTEETSFKAGIKRKQKKRTVAIVTFRKSLQGKGLRNLALSQILLHSSPGTSSTGYVSSWVHGAFTNKLNLIEHYYEKCRNYRYCWYTCLLWRL